MGRLIVASHSCLGHNSVFVTWDFQSTLQLWWKSIRLSEGEWVVAKTLKLDKPFSFATIMQPAEDFFQAWLEETGDDFNGCNARGCDADE